MVGKEGRKEGEGKLELTETPKKTRILKVAPNPLFPSFPATMGVRGLTTYLKEQPQAFTRTTTLEANPDLDPANAVALVVDAWR